MITNKSKQEALAKLFSMVNGDVTSVNQNDSNGTFAEEKVALEPISKREFLMAMHNVDKYQTSGLGRESLSGNPIVAPKPGEKIEPGFTANAGGPLGGSTASGDMMIVLQSIDSTLQSILQVLLALTSQNPQKPKQ